MEFKLLPIATSAIDFSNIAIMLGQQAVTSVLHLQGQPAEKFAGLALNLLNDKTDIGWHHVHQTFIFHLPMMVAKELMNKPYLTLSVDFGLNGAVGIVSGSYTNWKQAILSLCHPSLSPKEGRVLGNLLFTYFREVSIFREIEMVHSMEGTFALKG
jgi:hypothetical protein